MKQKIKMFEGTYEHVQNELTKLVENKILFKINDISYSTVIGKYGEGVIHCVIVLYVVSTKDDKVPQEIKGC